MEQRKSQESPLKDEEQSPQEWNNSMLDEEMEQIFHPSSQRFSIVNLHSGRNVERRPNFDERDYELHRRESLHHHQPLHRLHYRHRKMSHKLDQEETPVDTSHLDTETEQQNTTPDQPLLEGTSDTELVLIKDAGEKDKVAFYVGSASSIESSNLPSSSGISGKLGFTVKDTTVPIRSILRMPGNETKLGEERISTSAKTVSRTSLSISEAPSVSTTVETSFTDGAQPFQSKLPSADSDVSQGKLKVTFELGEEVQNEPKISFLSPARKTHHKHSKRHQKSQDSLASRKHQGSDRELKSYHDILEPEEAETLQTADIDDIASHRFEDPKAIRRHKIRAKSLVGSFVYSRKRDGAGRHSLPIIKKIFDHQPHEIFVELDELFPDEFEQELQWRETARWIKYEEDVEESAARWGKPHISSLSFHSLIHLRWCLETGVVLLDLEEDDLSNIANKIVENMVIADQILPDQKERILKILLLRHHHLNKKSHGPFLRRNSFGYGNLNMLNHDRNKLKILGKHATDHTINISVPSEDCCVPEGETNALMPNSNLSNVEMSPAMKRGSVSIDDNSKLDLTILRRVPANSEAMIVLVGAVDFLERPASAFVRLSCGRIMPNLLEIPIPLRFLFILLSPLHSEFDFHEIGRSISTLMSNKNFHEAAYKASDRKDLLPSINEFLADSVVLPPGDWEKKSLLPIDEIQKKSQNYLKRETSSVKGGAEFVVEPFYNPLKRTGRFFGGFINDIKHRYPLYKSDILDGLNIQCLASIIFIYFAALSGAVTFGGLLEDKTESLVGVSETLIVTSIGGILYSLLACQPLLIIGTTGPVLLFDEILFQFCRSNGVDFLRFRVWVSLWTAFISAVVVAFEGSSLVRFFSRFMQEIFATIISLLFIAESVMKLLNIFYEHPLKDLYNQTVTDAFKNETSQQKVTPKPNTALFSAILMIGTFYIALFLRHFRNSKFLGRSVRRMLGDFGVPIAIVIMVPVDYFSQVYTQKLNVPEGLSPSNPSVRGWIISPIPISGGEALGASVAGFLIFILLFLETQICELIFSKKERKLKKGCGFHVDMMLISFMEVACAVMGGPWLCATTVRSISHVSSLTVMSKTHAPGETPYIEEVKEQRITNFCVSFLVGISVLGAPILSQIPVAVLFGVFLYMGISALSGIHLFERILLCFMPSKHHPDFPFVRKVPTKKMHLYTAIQVACIVVLWAVKSTVLAPAFPFGLLGLTIIHSQLKCCFTESELKALDGEDAEKPSEELDFYEQIVA